MLVIGILLLLYSSVCTIYSSTLRAMGGSSPKGNRKDFWHHFYALRALLDADVAWAKLVASPSCLDLLKGFRLSS